MKTDLRAALAAVAKQQLEHKHQEPFLDLIDLAEESADVQLAVWQAGYTWGPEVSSDRDKDVIMASAPSDTEPRPYEVMGHRATWLKCKATDSSDAFKVTLIRRDWVVEEDRERFDRLLESSPAV